MGLQMEDPLQVPATHVKAEFAVYPLLHIGMQENPLAKPAQWLCDPYNKGFEGTVWQIVAEAIRSFTKVLNTERFDKLTKLLSTALSEASSLWHARTRSASRWNSSCPPRNEWRLQRQYLRTKLRQHLSGKQIQRTRQWKI